MRLDSYLRSTRPYLTDGGMETCMVFDHGFDLPCFSAHVLIDDAQKQRVFEKYFHDYLSLAEESGLGYVADTATWRLNSGWAKQLGMDQDALVEANHKSINFALELQRNCEHSGLPILVNGVVGPAGDGYTVDKMLSSDEAEQLHGLQMSVFAEKGIDLATAMTMTHSGEVVGIVKAAAQIELPIAISFTLETDGCLPSGQSLAEAIDEVDSETAKKPLYYMINCAHPDHFAALLSESKPWMSRIGGLRANASRMSHEELDACETLDAGNPEELADQYAGLRQSFPNLKVLGGCCGTDHRHVSCIARKAA